MATRSAIGVLNSVGVIESVYCHWDGYPEHNGVILENFYTDEDKVKALIAEGDISALGVSIGEKHDFNAKSEYVTSSVGEFASECTFYGRDRDEKDTESRTFDSVAEFMHHYGKSGCEFFYMFVGGEWFMLDNVYPQGMKSLSNLKVAA